jgi:hypothetical protein
MICVDESKVCGIGSDMREALSDVTSAMELFSRSMLKLE